MNPQDFFMNDLRIRKQEAAFKISLILNYQCFSKKVRKLLESQVFLEDYMVKHRLSTFSKREQHTEAPKMQQEVKGDKAAQPIKQDLDQNESIQLNNHQALPADCKNKKLDVQLDGFEDNKWGGLEDNKLGSLEDNHLDIRPQDDQLTILKDAHLNIPPEDSHINIPPQDPNTNIPPEDSHINIPPQDANTNILPQDSPTNIPPSDDEPPVTIPFASVESQLLLYELKKRNFQEIMQDSKTIPHKKNPKSNPKPKVKGEKASLAKWGRLPLKVKVSILHFLNLAEDDLQLLLILRNNKIPYLSDKQYHLYLEMQHPSISCFLKKHILQRLNSLRHCYKTYFQKMCKSLENLVKEYLAFKTDSEVNSNIDTFHLGEDIIKLVFEKLWRTPLFTKFIEQVEKTRFYDLILQNTSNKVDFYRYRGQLGETYIFSNEGLEYLDEIKKTFFPQRVMEFKVKYDSLFYEFLTSMERAKNQSSFRRSVTRFSYIPYRGLKTGVVLKANPEKSFEGLFKESHILLYHVGIEGDTHGLVLNKEFYFGNNWNLMGGPCDPEQVFVLHNISGVVGAKQIQKGLFLGGGVLEFLLLMWDVFNRLRHKSECQLDWDNPRLQQDSSKTRMTHFSQFLDNTKLSEFLQFQTSPDDLLDSSSATLPSQILKTLNLKVLEKLQSKSPVFEYHAEDYIEDLKLKFYFKQQLRDLASAKESKLNGRIPSLLETPGESHESVFSSMLNEIYYSALQRNTSMSQSLLRERYKC